MMNARIEEILRTPEEETAQSFEHARNLETRIGSRKPRRPRVAPGARRIAECV
jgi:hypothetical protein